MMTPRGFIALFTAVAIAHAAPFVIFAIILRESLK